MNEILGFDPPKRGTPYPRGSWWALPFNALKRYALKYKNKRLLLQALFVFYILYWHKISIVVPCDGSIYAEHAPSGPNHVSAYGAVLSPLYTQNAH